MLQSEEHAQQLQAAVLDAFTTARPCRGKQNRPPGAAALAAAAGLRGEPPAAVIVDLERYAELAQVAR